MHRPPFCGVRKRGPKSRVRSRAIGINTETKGAAFPNAGRNLVQFAAMHLPADRQSDLSLFERITVRLGEWSFGIAIVTFFVAVVTLLVFYGQFSEMANQTDLLARSARQARKDAHDTAVATGQQLAILRQQVEAAQGGVKAAQRQMRQDQRAWITISPNNPVQASDGGTLSVDVPLVNIGKTPAKKLHVYADIEIVKRTAAPRLTYGKEPHTEAVSGILYPNSLFPLHVEKKQSIPGTIPRYASAVVSHEDYLSLMRGDSYIATYVLLTYYDSFGFRHWEKYCDWNTARPPNQIAQSPAPPQGFSARKCADYNDVDDN
jgi:hypothetical protein